MLSLPQGKISDHSHDHSRSRRGGFKTRSGFGAAREIVDTGAIHAIQSSIVIHEHHIVVPRTARYYTLGPGAAPIDQLWFVCHGYGQLAARFITYFGVLDDGRRLVVAPEALSRYYLDAAAGGRHADARVGATWMTREDRLTEIEDQARYLDTLHTHIIDGLDGAAPGLTLLGFSQGAATVSRWAVRTSVPVHRLVLWGGTLPPDLDVRAHRARLATMRLTLVIGTEDQYITSDAVDAARERLTEAGVPARVITFEGGHRLDKETLRSVASLD
jgi:predicted esterase